MDTLFDKFSGHMEEFSFGHGSTSVSSYPKFSDGFKEIHESSETLLHPSDSSSSLSPASEEETIDVSCFNNPILKYINDILLDEDLESKNSMMQDCLALEAAEKSFYDVLNPQDPPMLKQPSLSVCQGSESSDEDSTQNLYQSSFAESLSDTLLVSDSFFQMQCPGNLASENKDDECNPTNGSKVKNYHRREDDLHPEEGRRNKQSAASADDSEPQEMFDKVLLCQGGDHHHHEWGSCYPCQSSKTNGIGKLQHNRQTERSKTNRSRRQKNNEEVVDLTSMLNQCAQAVASYDQRTASEILKKIRQHSSPYGHATQRLAHYFANGLDARLAGARIPSYSPLLSRQTSAADMLQAYQVYTTSSPFQMISQFLANRTIMKLAEKETRLHIIDFGISYGFQWPCLIQHLSERPGGPPTLHITAIELPQPGFRPTERVDETGRRLARYCARFNVPFEYDAISQKWETIRCEDLKIDRNELIVVNCLHRLRHIHDETVMEKCPRDDVVKLIKKINPHLFIHGIVNGMYNTPFFVTRFKEALLHFYAVFDMLEATISREDQCRLLLERKGYGREIMNVIACEGLERFERPDTYKKWQIRNVRAGLRQLPLNQELLKKAKRLLELMEYHSDFRIDEDGQWMLQGWKGRILMALSFWRPA